MSKKQPYPDFAPEGLPGGLEVLLVAESAAADTIAIRGGTPGLKLMEAAGRAIAGEVLARWKKRLVIVLAGPGNNGGDGFVAARMLAAKGWKVEVYLSGDPASLRGDAGKNAARWKKGGRKTRPLDEKNLDGICASIAKKETLLVDALFGAGFNRKLSGINKKTISRLAGLKRETGLGVLAVDVPSGLSGDSALAPGPVIPADVTVTFCRMKPAHIVMPGCGLCGETVVADIGIDDSAVAATRPRQFINSPLWWAEGLRFPGPDDNKYSRGHVVVAGGDEMPGAAILAATAARRAGSGLATIVVGEKSLSRYSCVPPGTIVSVFSGISGFGKLLADKRKNAFIIGPGAGARLAGADVARLVTDAIRAGKSLVVDADGLNAFSNAPKKLFSAIREAPNGAPIVLTPHEGEFGRIFPSIDISTTGRLAACREAARRSGAVVLLKGHDTIIAAPDGRAAINPPASPWLATAGSGDVLAGVIGAMLAGGMDPFSAAAAAAWMHARAAAIFGPGLVAEDLAPAFPLVWAELEAVETEEGGPAGR